MFGLEALIIFSWSIVLGGLAAGLLALKHVTLQYKMDRESRLSEREGSEKSILNNFEEVKKNESAIKDKELATLDLYEITKKMSEAMKLEDIFSIFSSFLKANYSFRKCALLIVNWQEEAPRLNREYEVWKEAPGAGPGDKIDFNAAMKLFSENPREIYLTRQAEGKVFKDLGVKDDSISTLTGIPLMSEKKMVALLMVENLPRVELETFTILSMELALEIKKVLLYEIVERLAITDSLTDLYVRRYFTERVEEELQRSRRYKFNFAFLMADIDNFKRCNDRYGHLVGDMILKKISAIIKESVREIDLVARYGGEEFAIMLPETSAEPARVAAERIRKKIEDNALKAYDENLQITVSIGASIYPEDSQDVNGMIEKADLALYAAKKSGKNIVCKYKREYNSHQ